MQLLTWTFLWTPASWAQEGAAESLTLPDDARGAFAVYCAQSCAEPAAPLARRLPSTRVRQPIMAAERWEPGEFRLPDVEQIQEWGQGDLSGLAGAQDVVVVSWAAPRADAAATLAAAGRVALSMGAWFEDLDTGALYDAASLSALLARYEARTPDVTAMLLLEASGAPRGGEELRLVTRGMGKLGLPELVVEGVPEAEANAAGLLLNTTAQALYERGGAEPVPAVLDLSGADLRAEPVRALSCGVRGEVTLAAAEPGAADPLGPLYALTFSGDIAACAPPSTVEAPERQGQQPASLREARAAALARLQGPVRAAFAAGLPAGEALWVKARFDAPAGSGMAAEWLWVRVEQWRSDGELVGRLESRPARQQGALRQGDEVSLPLSGEVIFDYLWLRADGRQEGNATQAFLTRR